MTFWTWADDHWFVFGLCALPITIGIILFIYFGHSERHDADLYFLTERRVTVICKTGYVDTVTTDKGPTMICCNCLHGVTK